MTVVGNQQKSSLSNWQGLLVCNHEGSVRWLHVNWKLLRLDAIFLPGNFYEATAMIDLSAVPEANVKAYKLLFLLEVVLREYIIEKMESAYGVHWHKTALPSGEMLTKFKNAKEYETRTPWISHIPLHPIYYLDFPDLATLLEKKDNWENVFKGELQRKDIVVADLRKLEPIRNKIAHGRRATNSDCSIIQSTVEVFVELLGHDKFSLLTERCTSVEDIRDRMLQLRLEAEEAIVACCEAKEIPSLKNWLAMKKSWWFDDDYLLVELNSVRNFFQCMEEYHTLPRFRGVGYQIDKWIESNTPREKWNALEKTLDQLIP